ncbi:MAG: hypothetical protein H6684_09355 [Deltaproteobacteria bacterium]|nr:hypothetical protein [Deltaproteobacteria bacterium]MCB9488922.1 hypothetical protein [Deltaproteobacteria bacterium]
MNIEKRIQELGDRSIAELLKTPVVERSDAERLASFLSAGPKHQLIGKEDAALAGLTIGDLLYDVSRVDPTVLEGIDFARAQDLADPFKLASYAQDRLQGVANGTDMGNLNQLHGYVAERIAAQHLQSQGHEVEFPEDSNQAGFDLIVNGVRSQVKNLESPEGVYEHLERYPDIPVYVNADLAEEFADYENVIPIPTLIHAQVKEATQDSVDASIEILDFEIPMIALTIATAKNTLALVRGKTDKTGAIHNILMDTAGGIAGGVAGAKAFALAGSVLGPYGIVVGGLVGTAVGANRGRRFASFLKANILCADEEDSVEAALKTLLQKAKCEALIKLEIMKRKFDRMAQILSGNDVNRRAIWEEYKWRTEQETEYVEAKIRRIEFGMSDPRNFDEDGRDILFATQETFELVTQVGIPPANISTEMRKLSQALEILVKKQERYHLR